VCFRGKFISGLKAAVSPRFRLEFLRQPRSGSRSQAPSRPGSDYCSETTGWSTPRRPFGGPEHALRYLGGVHPPRRHLSPQAGCTRPATTSPSAGETQLTAIRSGSWPCRSTSFLRRFPSCTSLPTRLRCASSNFGFPRQPANDAPPSYRSAFKLLRGFGKACPLRRHRLPWTSRARSGTVRPCGGTMHRRRTALLLRNSCSGSPPQPERVRSMNLYPHPCLLSVLRHARRLLVFIRPRLAQSANLSASAPPTSARRLLFRLDSSPANGRPCPYYSGFLNTLPRSHQFKSHRTSAEAAPFKSLYLDPPVLDHASVTGLYSGALQIQH